MNKYIGAVFIALFLGLFLGLAALADGVDAGSFVRDGVGARALGIGGAFVSLADDASTVVWNPAGLAQLDGISIGGMYTDRFGLGIYFQSVGATVRFSDFGAGLTMVRSSIDGIPFYGDEGEGFFSETQTLFLAAVGYDLSAVFDLAEGPLSSLLVGGSVKYYSHSLLEGSGTGLGFDLGLLATFSLEWGEVSLGLNSLDIAGTAITWRGTDHEPANSVPWINKLGVSFSLLEQSLRLAADVNVAIGRAHLNRLNLGVEYWPIAELGARAGVALRADGSYQLAAGASVKWRGIMLDYAYVPHPILGGSHILSVQFHFDVWEDAQEDGDQVVDDGT